MGNISYYEAIKGNQNAFGLRVKLVDYALRCGKKSAAKLFSCNVKTVRKWVASYKKHGLAGLKDHSRRPHHSPNQTPIAEERAIQELRASLGKVSPRRMKREFGVKRAEATIYRIIKKDAKKKGRWRKHKRKNDLRKVKAKLKVFEKIQVDVKELKDIPNYFPYMLKQRLPKYQFTARDVKSGALFFAYGHSKESTSAATFCAYLMEHLKRFGIQVKDITIQTDNGVEFVGNWRVGSASSFSKLIEQIYLATHARIPPAAPTYNSDVETSHARIEEEFYDIEEFDNLWVMLCKALSYQVYFNLIRPNTYKQLKSPLKIIEEELGPVDPYLLVLQPIILDQHFDLYLNKVQPDLVTSGGHHLPEYPRIYNKGPRVTGALTFIY